MFRDIPRDTVDGVTVPGCTNLAQERRKRLDPRASRALVRAAMALTPREASSKARTLRDISESTTLSLAPHLAL